MKKIILLFVLFISNQSFSQRIALLETFTSASCSACGYWEPLFNDVMDTFSNPTIRISYHTATVGLDSMNAQNPTDVSARYSYYGVTGTPWTQINGNISYGTGVLVNFWSPTIVDTFDSDVTPKYSVQFEDNFYNNKFHKGKVIFKSEHAFASTDTLQAQIVLVEKKILKSQFLGSPGSNVQTEYEYVMRKMLLGSSGSTLMNTTLSGRDTLSYSIQWPYIKNPNDMQIVAFVQNKNTKEVYQAGLIEPTFNSGDTLYNSTNVSVSLQDTITNINIYNLDTNYTNTPQANDTVISQIEMNPEIINIVDTNTVYSTFDPITTIATNTITTSSYNLDTITTTFTVNVYIDTTISNIGEIENLSNDYFVESNNYELKINSISNNNEILPINIYDASGRNVFSQKEYRLGTSISFDVNAGIYLIVLNNRNVIKLIK